MAIDSRKRELDKRDANSLLPMAGSWLSLLCFLPFAFPSATLAQGGVPGVGYSPEHDYSESAIDSFDLDSGNLMLHIPIVSYKQRGKLADFSLVARYNALQYTATDDFRAVLNPYSLMGMIPPATTDQNFPYWSVVGGGVQIVRANTLFGGGYDIPYVMSNGEPSTYRQDYIEDPTGGQHLLYLPVGSSHSRTMDGSGIEAAVNIGPGTGGILDSNGVHHSADADTQGDGFFDAVSDPSGNSITPVTKTVLYTFYSASWNITQVDHWTDSAGRAIPAPSRGGNLPNNSPGCESLDFPSSGGQKATYQFCYTNVGVATHFGSSRIGDIGPFPNPFLTSIVLPNQTAYTFTYDDWGALHQIGLPDGGTITYEWSASVSGVSGSRGLISRTLDPGNGAPARIWTYCAGGDTRAACTGVPQGVLAVRDPNGNDLWRIYGSLPNFRSGATVQFQGAGSTSGGTILKSVLKTYCGPTTGTVFWRSVIYDAPKICQIDTTLSDGETYSEITTYDDPVTLSDPNDAANVDSTGHHWSGTGSGNLGVPISKTVTAYGATSAGSNVRTTTTHYLWQDDSNYYQKNFLELPASVTTTAGDGTTVLSKDTYTYDDSPSPQGYYGNRTSDTKWVAGSASVKTTAVYNANGMVTDTYDGNSNANLTGQPGNHVTTTYDTTGLYPTQVTQSTTGSAQHTDYYSYDANTGNLTKHVDQNGSSATDTTHMTSWSYDNMGRAIAMSTPDGGGATYRYTDVGGDNCTMTNAPPYSTVITTKLAGTATMTSKVFYNGLGEVTSQTGSNGASVDTGYDLLGHKGNISNPYFTTPDAYISYKYDGLDRPVYKCNQDNGTGSAACAPGTSYQSWTYSGPSTTFKDENLNAYTRVTDSLGRLVSVTEPGGAKTYYQYDPLGNLLCAGQDGGSGGTFTNCASLTAAWRPRIFTYDGLSRLMSSYNPEAGSTSYIYDANSNLISKSDARNLTTSYQYDALNRLIRKTVQVVNASGAVANQYVSNCYQYDVAASGQTGANAVGHMTAEWTQAGQACATAYDKTVAITAKLIPTYDKLGRPLTFQQCVMATCQAATPLIQPFAQAFSYDLAGNTTSWTDGRGLMTFNEQYDSAGRPVSVTNSVSGSGLPAVLFSAQGYTPSNGLQSWSVGGYLNLNRTYDSRLRISSQSANH